MILEFKILALAALLQVVLFVLNSIATQRQVGSDYAMGPRDEPRVLTGTAGRLQRAMNNHFESLILFTIATIVTVFEDGFDQYKTIAILPSIYLAARVLYIPAYALGWQPWRSVIWFIGFLATIAMIVSALI